MDARKDAIALSIATFSLLGLLSPTEAGLFWSKKKSPCVSSDCCDVAADDCCTVPGCAPQSLPEQMQGTPVAPDEMTPLVPETTIPDAAVPPVTDPAEMTPDVETVVPDANVETLEPVNPDQVFQPQPQPTFVASNQFSGGGTTRGFADASIGDFFGNNGQIAIVGQTGVVNFAGAAGDRRFKLTENISPIPVDRFFFTFNHFSQPVRDVNGDAQDVDRYLLGLEKTFFNNNMSIEVRVPMVRGLDNNQVRNDVAIPNDNTLSAELGDVTLIGKAIAHQTDRSVFSYGLGMTLPTADDTNVIGDPATFRLENQALHLLPFMSAYFRPNNDMWITFSTQFDFDVVGSSLITNDGLGNVNSIETDRFYEQSLLFLDMTAGWWFLEKRDSSSWLQRMAAILELHYTTTLTDFDSFQSSTGQFIVGSGESFTSSSFSSFGSGIGGAPNVADNGRLDVWNLTLGLRAKCIHGWLITGAVVLPLTKGRDQIFDTEYAIQVVRPF